MLGHQPDVQYLPIYCVYLVYLVPYLHTVLRTYVCGKWRSVDMYGETKCEYLSKYSDKNRNSWHPTRLPGAKNKDVDQLMHALPPRFKNLGPHEQVGFIDYRSVAADQFSGC